MLNRLKAHNSPQADEDAIKWRFFAEYFDGIIVIVDDKRKITFVNKSFAGSPVEEIMGTEISDWIHKGDRDALAESIERALKHGGPFKINIRGEGSNNNLSWYSVRGGALRENNKVSGVILICADITDLKNTIQQMEDNKAAMTNLLEDIERARIATENAKAEDEAILSNIGEGLAVINAEGTLELANQRLGEILLIKPDEIIGRNWPQALIFKYEDNRDVEVGKIPIQQAFDFKTRVATTPLITNSMRFFLLRSDGKRIPIQVTASPMIIGGRISKVIAVIRDVSKEIELEKTKTEFVSIASHQLRTPLSTVNWYTEMLLSGDIGDVNSKQKDYLNEIYSGNQRMIDLVNALLNVSRLEVGAFIVEPKMISVKDSIKDVLNEIQLQLVEKKIKVEESYGEDLPNVEADPNLARIIIQNLITNAMKYTNTKISISLTLQKGVLINQRDNKDSTGILIKISDDGLGIPEAQKHQIFTKLFRADNARIKDPQGTGLGLYIVKSIIDQTGGEIWFDSEEGKGTTFYVLAPIQWMVKRTGTRKLLEA